MKLWEIWTRILERDDLGFEEDFFDAGGDSLGAINMLAEVDQRLGSETSALAANFLDEPTLSNLTSLVGTPPLPRPRGSDSSDIRIFPVREAGTGKRLFCVPPDEEEGLFFRRLATHLNEKMDLFIVRPANTCYNHALSSFERSGQETAAAICRMQPEGPYFVSGYCYGGVVAFETARQLTLEGQDVGLILFDVPMPGCPGLIRGWNTWARRAWGQWLLLWSSEHPGLMRNLRRFSHVLAWSALVPFRRLLVPMEHYAVTQKIIQWAQFDNYPLYKAAPIDASILHFLATDEPHMIQRESRFGWRAVARRGIEERFLPLDHPNLFHESNLPEMVETIRKWCGGF
jgi:thioesterase domain-containing protein